VSRNKWTWGIAKRTIRLLPSVKRFYTTPPSVDWERTVAYTSDLSGLKAYNYGGIVINHRLVAPTDYEALRREVRAAILGIRHPATGDRLVRACIPREDLYEGPHIGKYPDLVYELAPGYGAGWSTKAGLLEPAASHNISPGSHRRDTSVLLVAGAPQAPSRTDVTCMDIAATILGLLGLPSDGVAGRSLFAEARS
jgi:predicted AlkP superfamily phosphohydrolase/phosphomutase